MHAIRNQASARLARLARAALPTAAALVLAAVAAGGLATGCSTTLGYYWQALDGQAALVREARPIPEVIGDPLTSEELKLKLGRVREIREFASGALALPDNGSYRRYAELHRRFVVWNVFAAPEFSLEPK
jgi:predicted aminopeptidase